MFYEIVGGLAFPLAKTAEPLSESWATRLLARLIVAACAAAGIGLAARWARPKPKPATEVA